MRNVRLTESGMSETALKPGSEVSRHFDETSGGLLFVVIICSALVGSLFTFSAAMILYGRKIAKGTSACPTSSEEDGDVFTPPNSTSLNYVTHSSTSPPLQMNSTASPPLQMNSTVSPPLQMKVPVRIFSRGRLYYRSKYVDQERGWLYVGAMEYIFKLQLDNINNTNTKVRNLPSSDQQRQSCIPRFGLKDVDCRNHIKVIQPIRNGSTLYVCGTNARKPVDWQVTAADLSTVPAAEQVPIAPANQAGAEARCASDFYDNATAVWVDDSLENGTSSLFSGGVIGNAKNDFLIFRTGPPSHGYLRTEQNDLLALHSPQFVGSYAIGEHVFLFFREVAGERWPCGRELVSTVARVCKKDKGTGFYRNKWSSFTKIRLNCSEFASTYLHPKEERFRFRQIQDVYHLPAPDGGVFYATFYTVTHGFHDSAICSFAHADLQRAFAGPFASIDPRKPEVPASTVPNKDVPQSPLPRPGTCVPDSMNPAMLPFDVVRFSRMYPLMASAAKQRTPALSIQGEAFLAVAAIQLHKDWGSWILCYVGTAQGQIFKISEDISTLAPTVLDNFTAAPNEAIWKIEISSKYQSVYVFSDDAVRQFPLDACEERYLDCASCIRDLFCGWDKDRCLSGSITTRTCT